MQFSFRLLLSTLQPRLSKFYNPTTESQALAIIRECFLLVSKRADNVCNFLDGGELLGEKDTKLIYRHYATLYFVFAVDSSESELGILDLIQVGVDCLCVAWSNTVVTSSPSLSVPLDAPWCGHRCFLVFLVTKAASFF